MQQQLLVTKRIDQMSPKQLAFVLAQKTDLELKTEFPVFWELLRLKRKREEID